MEIIRHFLSIDAPWQQDHNGMRDTFGTAFERTHMTSYDPTADLQALDALEMKLFARSYAMTDINFAGETVDPPTGAAARGEALALLSETNRGNSAAIIERIRNNWKKTGADTGYEFTCELDKIS